ncbi:hypothetical protein SprV_0702307800 [Sparganum proliferum]
MHFLPEASFAGISRASQASQVSAKTTEQPIKDYGSVQSAKCATNTSVADKVTKSGSSTGAAQQAKITPEKSPSLGMYESPGLAKFAFISAEHFSAVNAINRSIDLRAPHEVAEKT